MLVRNPKKRPSASKMLSVRTAHKLLLSLKMRNDDKCIRALFLILMPPSGQKISYCRIKTTFSLLVLWNLRLTVTTSRPVSLFILDRTNLDWLSLSLSLSILCFLCLLSSSVQHMFLTQQCLNQELTLDLLEKFRNPEKLKSCLMTEDEEMEVGHDSAVWRQTLHVVLIHLRLRLRPGIADSEWILLSLMIQRWRCRDLWRGSSLSTNTTGRRGRALT